MAGVVRTKGIRIRTACTSEDDFIAAFHRNVDESSLFITTEAMHAVGSECAFSFELADGQPMLRGLGTVLNAWPTADNRFGVHGIELGFLQLTSATEPMFGRLLLAHAKAAVEVADREADEDSKAEDTTEGPALRRRSKPQTRPLFGLVPGAPATGEMEAVDVELEPASVSTEMKRSITREFRAISPSTPPPTPPERPSAPALPPPPPPPFVGPLPASAASDEKTVESLHYAAPQPVAPETSSRFARGSSPAVPPDNDEHTTKSAQPYVAPAPAPPAPPAPSPAATAPIATATIATAPTAPIQASWLASRPVVSRAQHIEARVGAQPWWRNTRVGGVFASGIVLGILMSALFRCGGGGSDSKSKAVASAAPIREPANCPPPDAVGTPESVAATKKQSPANVATATKKSAAKPQVATAKPAARPQAATKPAPAKPSLATTKPAPQVATTKPAPANPSVAAPTAKPQVATTKPAPTVATTKPAPTAKPPVATTKPAPTAKPPVAAVTTKPAPATATTKPAPATATTTTQPAPATTAKPQVATTKPAPATTAKPHVTTKPAPATATTKPAPAGTAKPPVATTKPAPATTTKPPVATTKPATTSKPPVATTKPAPAKPTTAKPTVATTKPTPAKPPKKRGCATLACI